MRPTPRQRTFAAALLMLLAVGPLTGAQASAAAATPVCRVTVAAPVHQPYASFGIVAKTGRVDATVVVECFAFDIAEAYDIEIVTSAERLDGGAYVAPPGSAQGCHRRQAHGGYAVHACDYQYPYESAQWAAQAWQVCTQMDAPRTQPRTCTKATTTPV